MTEEAVRVPVDKLRAFAHATFERVGVAGEDAAVAADVLMASDLRGIESHGVGRLKMYYDWIKKGIISPQVRFEVVREGPTTAVVDAHTSLGHPVAHRAMSLAIAKARPYGLGAVAVRNSSHYGIAGYYALMAAREGMIGLSFTNARPSVAPTFGVEPILGTNPIAFACPTDEEFPFCFDAATSITQRGKIEVLAREGRPTPAGWVIDRRGDLATDTTAILQGIPKELYALLPLGGAGEEMGGHKGYGLATMVEILSAALPSGAFLWALSGMEKDGTPRPHRLGHFFLAISVEHFVPLSEFRSTVGGILRELRAAAKAPGQNRIYTAGEKAHLREKEVLARGVPLTPALRKELEPVAGELGIPLPW
ncbi:MAG TPA: Ldh family oxidoreductase [Candidatus Acetothermia bacterium]|nr:Ldh family oxidoreductase [Candidatus Acetothermia bacterium]